MGTKTVTRVGLYEVNGSDDECKVVGYANHLFVENHWCQDDRVVLDISQLPEGTKTITVLYRDLRVAMENAGRR